MRTKSSMMNLLVSFAMQAINIVLLFCSRQLFIRYFSIEYLGINGLFSNILTVFSLAELGIGTAMMYGMYAPAATDDREQICRLMNLYKKLYMAVGAVVFIVGAGFAPFLNLFVKDNTIPDLHLIYFMYLADSVLSYFFSYKQTIIQANQKGYIISAVTQFIRTVQIAVQMLTVLYFSNFYIYIALQLIAQTGTNVVLAHIAERMFPYIKKNTFGLPEPQEQKEIRCHIQATAMHRFGGTFVMHTDNLIISACVGLAAVGLYSNYKMVLNSLKVFLSYIYNAFTASIGNLAATESKEKVLFTYQCLNFLMSMVYGWSSVCLFVLFNPFIEYMFGREYLLSGGVVAILVVDFYLWGMRQMTLRFRDGMGLYRRDRYKAVFEVIVNLAASLILVFPLEIAGVILGTIISTMTTNFWVEPMVFFKYGIGGSGWTKNLLIYFVKYLKYTMFSVGICAICFYMESCFPPVKLIHFFFLGIGFTMLYGIGAWLVFGRSREWNFLWEKSKWYIMRREG